MAAHYVAAIEASKSRGPYFLGGHSLGGWVAYEMAQILLRRGQEAPLVAVIDTPAPAGNPPRDTSDWDNARWILELSHRIGELLNPDLNVSLDDMRRLDTEAQYEYLKQALLRAGLFPGDAGSDHLRNIVRLFRAHSSISYRLPRNPLPVKVALLRTAAPHSESPFAGDPSWGWSRVAETEVHMVPGEHLSCLRPPHVLTLAERLTACLDQARRAHRERDKGIAACPKL
jgi:thioesterase domain-containing protein